MKLYRVISGGQTGADQAGLFAATKFKVRTGGTAPDNWNTSRGSNPLLAAFGLQAYGNLNERTEINIRDSDGTVIFTEQFDSPGSVITRSFCLKHKKPFLDIDLSCHVAKELSGELTAVGGGLSGCEVAQKIAAFLREHNIGILNVAGNRERHKNNLTFRHSALLLSETFLLLALEKELVQDTERF